MSNLKLDKKDASILRELERDGRALIKTISKRTGIPRDSVNYRIKRLRKEGVIKCIVPVCDTDILGYPVFTWMNIKLQNFDSDIENRFVSFLKELKNVVYFAKVTGSYHYMLSIAVKSIPELDEVINKIVSEYPQIIKDYNTSLIIDETQYDTFYRLIP